MIYHRSLQCMIEQSTFPMGKPQILCNNIPDRPTSNNAFWSHSDGFNHQYHLYNVLVLFFSFSRTAVTRTIVLTMLVRLRKLRSVGCFIYSAPTLRRRLFIVSTSTSQQHW